MKLMSHDMQEMVVCLVDIHAIMSLSAGSAPSSPANTRTMVVC